MRFLATVRKVLSDGEWHSFAELYSATQFMFPPERAIRRLQLERMGRTDDFDRDVRRGKRRIVSYYLTNHAQKSGSREAALEKRGHGPESEYRLKRMSDGD